MESLELLNNPKFFGNFQDMDSTTPCQYCFEEIPSRMLKQHISERHGQVMPHTCSLCGRGYMSSSGLNHHLKAHEGKTYSCPVCDAQFAQKGIVRRHVKNIHQSDQCCHCLNVFKFEDFNQHVMQCALAPNKDTLTPKKER